ncbi:hypothetical protein J6590_104708 [Homalodisca vitripennis]|nr:hypothetical protein J6590_104708 [Homalodisca vitripennis]
MPLPMWQQCLLLWQPRQTLLAPIGQVANQAVLPLTPTSERPAPPIRNEPKETLKIKPNTLTFVISGTRSNVQRRLQFLGDYVLVIGGRQLTDIIVNEHHFIVP